MDTATIKQLKEELSILDRQQLIEIILRLSKLKKENKELLSYLIFDAKDEHNYIINIKKEININFSNINSSSFFYIKKSIRKILKIIKNYIRYSNVKETEIELLLYFCEKIYDMTPSIKKNQQMTNLFERELKSIEKKVSTLHDDLRYDYRTRIKKLKKSI